MNAEQIDTYIYYQIAKRYQNITIDQELKELAKEELSKKEPRILKVEKDTEIRIEYGNLIEEFYAQILKEEIEKYSNFYRFFVDVKKIIIQVDETQCSSIEKDDNAYYIRVNTSDAYIISKFTKAIIPGADDSEKDEIYDNRTLNEKDVEKDVEEIYFICLQKPTELNRKRIIELLSKRKDYEGLKKYLLGEDAGGRLYLHIATIQLEVLKKNLKSVYPEICKSLSREDYESIKKLMFTHLEEIKEKSLHKQEIIDKIENNPLHLNQKDYIIIMARKILRELDPSLELLNHFDKKKKQNQIELTADQEEKSNYKKMSQTKSCYNCSTEIINSHFHGIIEDVLGLIHETVHSYIEENNKGKKYDQLLDEFPSVYYETKAEEYLAALNLESNLQYFRIDCSFRNWVWMYYIFEMMSLLEKDQLTYKNIEPLAAIEDVAELTEKTTKNKAFFPPSQINEFILEYGEESAQKLLDLFAYPISFLLTKEAIRKKINPEEIKEICKHIEKYNLQDALKKITNSQKKGKAN